MTITRRGLIFAGVASLAAPAIVRASSLMAISPLPRAAKNITATELRRRQQEFLSEFLKTFLNRYGELIAKTQTDAIVYGRSALFVRAPGPAGELFELAEADLHASDTGDPQP